MRPSIPPGLPGLLALLTLAVAPFAQGRRWDPLFDYTNLRPTDAELWGAISPLPVTLQAAVAAARESEKTVHVMKASLDRKGEPVWRLETITVDAEGKPHRVDLTMSALEPKVVKRTELEAMLPADEEAWRMFQKHTVPLDDAIQVGNESLNKVPDKKVVVDGHAFEARFVPVDKASRWELEVIAMDSKRDVPRCYQVFVSAKDPIMQRVVMEDRYPGEPLRNKGEPVQHSSGLYVFDLREGDGPKVPPDAKVRVQYRLFLLDGTKIHDTWEKRRPETFALAEAPLKGITQALPDMRVGGRRKIIIPYDSAFGEAGSVTDKEGNVVVMAPPKATIVCDIDVEALVSD